MDSSKLSDYDSDSMIHQQIDWSDISHNVNIQDMTSDLNLHKHPPTSTVYTKVISDSDFKLFASRYAANEAKLLNIITLWRVLVVGMMGMMVLRLMAMEQSMQEMSQSHDATRESLWMLQSLWLI